MRAQLLSIALFIVGLSPAWAQDSSSTRTLSSGDVDSNFVVAPDFKFTDINGDFANLAGGYGGWMIDKKFLVGGGVYTLTNGSGPNAMTYGGGVFEYFVNQDSLVNVSVRGLVGGGNATLAPNLPGFDREFDFGFGAIDFGRFPGSRGRFPANIGRVDVDDLLRRVGGRLDLDDLEDRFSTSSSFFIAEPEVNVLLNISETFRFSVGGSYRFIGGAGRLEDRLDGFAASVALKMIF